MPVECSSVEWGGGRPRTAGGRIDDGVPQNEAKKRDCSAGPAFRPLRLAQGRLCGLFEDVRQPQG